MVGGAAVIAILIVQGALSLLAPRMRSGRAKQRALTYSPGEGVWLLITALFLAGLLAASIL